MTCIHVYAVSSSFLDSIGGLPMRIWKGATAGAGCFANGQAAHYRGKFSLLHFLWRFFFVQEPGFTLYKVRHMVLYW